ncbi:MAG: hypothetical protein COA49_02005 [Bacteroidetes bacterium]|nr:MAG: hypothetical protein COA49_02005 [Bacteroidota bacterium]
MKELFSTDNKKVKSALDQADKKGTVKWIKPLLEAFRDRNEDDLRNRMRGMLSSVKLSAAEDIFIEILSDMDFKDIHADILGFIWSAGFVPSESIDIIVRAATSGDFRAAIEGLTLIEQCDLVENEQLLLESIITVRNAMDDKSKSKSHALFIPMLEVLEHLERNQ